MSARLKLEDVHCTVDGLVTVARVRLSHRGRSASGTASARTTEGIWRHVVAEAALSALREIIDGNLDVTLDAVAEVGSGRHPIIVVTMAMGRGRNEVFLSGTASLQGDRVAAVAKAVLHRLNRGVEPVLAIAASSSSVGPRPSGLLPRIRSNSLRTNAIIRLVLTTRLIPREVFAQPQGYLDHCRLNMFPG